MVAKTLTEAARDVIASWEKGDLAAAVRALEAALKEADEPHFVLVQEGGSSCELYVHGHESAVAAQEDREDCARGAYRTTPWIEVPRSLASHPEFYNTLDAFVGVMNELDYVNVPATEGEENNERG